MSTPPSDPVRVTMRTIAERLGVTKTTVSLALRGSKSISKKTTQRVVEMARELNYRPDPAISAIATRRWAVRSPESHRVVAYLNYRGPLAKYGHKHYFTPASERAHDLGYRLDPFFVDDYPSAQALSRVLHTRGIRGVLVPALERPTSKRVLGLDWSLFTSVCCGIGRVRPPLHTVAPDTYGHTYLAWEMLAKAGYRRIGAALHCHAPLAFEDRHRMGASYAAMHLLGLEESSRIPIHTDDIQDKESLLRWYEKYQPEVILGFNQAVACHLEEYGVRVPDDVEFVSLLTPDASRWSGIVHDLPQIARISVEMLDYGIRHNQWGVPENPNLTLVPPKWNQGKTLLAKPVFSNDKVVSADRISAGNGRELGGRNEEVFVEAVAS